MQPLRYARKLVTDLCNGLNHYYNSIYPPSNNPTQSSASTIQNQIGCTKEITTFMSTHYSHERMKNVKFTGIGWCKQVIVHLLT